VEQLYDYQWLLIQAFLPHKLNGPYNARIMNTPIPVNDEARQRYLREMGVAVYFPRRVLPGAAASRRYHTESDAREAGAAHTAATVATPAAARETVPGTSGTSSQSPVNLEGLKDSLAAGPAIPSTPETSPSVAGRQVESAMETGESLSFRFTWFRPDERLCVIAGHTAAALPAQSRQMLQRILAALSPRYRELTLQGEAFHWPLDPAMPGDEDAARQVVRAFLRRRHGGTQPPLLLVLMDASPGWLFPADAGETVTRMLELSAVPGGTQQVLRVPALETMARNTEAKRPAWEAMQLLIRPLAECGRN
jgi:hypothetical protein